MAKTISPTELSQLLCFAEVVECGSFAAAGRKLGLSTSVISRKVQGFERTHRIRLLHRSTHTLSLTPEGEALLAEVLQAQAGMDRLNLALEQVSDGEGGTIKISAPVGFVRNCLIPCLTDFAQVYPDIRLDVRAEDRLADLAKEGVDLAIRAGPIERVPGLTARLLFRCPWIACASPEYLARYGSPSIPSDLAAHRLIVFRKSQTGLIESWRLSNGRGEVGRYGLRSRLIFDDAATVMASASAGFGIVWVPQWLASADLDSGRVVEVLGQFRVGLTSMTMLRRTGVTRLPRVDILADFLKQAAGAWRH